MSKSLNDISPNFRDYLLKRNLAFAKTIEDNSLTSRATGIGKPVSLSENNDMVNPSIDFDKITQSYMNQNLSNNEYNFEDGYGTDYGKSIASENSDSVFTVSNLDAVKRNLSYNPYSIEGEVGMIPDNDVVMRQNGPKSPYLDSNGNINGTDSDKINDINTIASILTGDGIGLNGNNDIIPNFDVRSSLSGRALMEIHNINDTPLGKIQKREVATIFKNKIIEGTQRELLGKVNLSPINLIKGGEIIRPNYDITIGGTTGKRVLNTLENIGGFEVPISKMSEGSSIFHKGQHISVLELTNNQIKDTGRGQVEVMFNNLKENIYIPPYKDDRIKDGELKGTTYDTVSEDFEGLSTNNSKDTYDSINPNPDSLLGKTKELFDNKTNKDYYPINTIQTMINEKGVQVDNPSEVTNPVNFNGTKIISRGSGVKSAEGLNGSVDPEKVFARVFTTNEQYDRISRLQKHRGLDNPNARGSSVLGSNGFVKVSPYHYDDLTDNMKKFMFSLENLAWDGETNNLPSSEIGPGDPKTGSKGRIMWFPPYDISIDDSSSASWETTSFIGRGEPIYTYNNTERFGTLSFKVIIDYPSYLDDTKGISDDILTSMLSGVEGLKPEDLKNFSANEIQQVKQKIPKKTSTIQDTPEIEPEDFNVYYINDVSSYDETYESDGLNEFFTPEYRSELSKQLREDCPSCKLIIQGFASYDGTQERNDVLIRERANLFKEYLENNLTDIENQIVVAEDIGEVTGCNGDQPIDSPCKKEARRVEVRFEYVPSENETNIKNEEKFIADDSDFQNLQVSKDVARRFMNEARYFKELEVNDPLVFAHLKDKIDYFHPAFHSTTPEGFNSRLTFLQQCVRQGPTRNEGRANNMAFGKPPICILRLGDFYHTKIAIDTVNFTFDPLVWDINPEGIGVQPMICNVQLSFKFIGGSSLRGPINKLQNAVSFNFFANTEVFDPRADRIVKKDGEFKYESNPRIVEQLEGLDSLKQGPITPTINETIRAEKDIPEVGSNTSSEITDSQKFLNLSIVEYDYTDDMTQGYYSLHPRTIGDNWVITEDIPCKVTIFNSENNTATQVAVININDSVLGQLIYFDYDTSEVDSLTNLTIKITNVETNESLVS